MTIYFNPRSREGSDLLGQAEQRRNLLFQSTLPRRERRKKVFAKAAEEFISIHAPAKGATLAWIYELDERDISIHAPAKGATRILAHILDMGGRFQSTLPRRERHTAVLQLTAHWYISIHAPAKGATAKITKTIPDDFHKINNCNNSFA